MKVYIVTKTYPTYDLVNDDLEICMGDVAEIVAVYSTREKAEESAEDLRKMMKEAEEELDCDPLEFGVVEFDVL